MPVKGCLTSYVKRYSHKNIKIAGESASVDRRRGISVPRRAQEDRERERLPPSASYPTENNMPAAIARFI